MVYVSGQVLIQRWAFQCQAFERDAFERVKNDRHNSVKGKVFPHSLPSVGPGADPGVQAVSPQVT